MISLTDCRLLSAPEDAAIRVWDVDRAKELAPRTSEPIDLEMSSTFWRDCNRVVFLPDDTTVRTWFLCRILDNLIG